MTSLDSNSYPMYVVPEVSPPRDVSPPISPLPASVPLPAFIAAPNEYVHGAQENKVDCFSDTSSTTCPEDELASKSSIRSQRFTQIATMSSALISRSQFASKPGSKKPFWQLLWCCERCNKATNSETKNTLQNMAKIFGGSLQCIKKADKIKSHPTKCDYVVVADWREAKPIVDIFVEVPSMTRPTSMLIICSTVRSYENALHWVAKEAVMKAPGVRFDVFRGQDDTPDDFDDFCNSIQRGLQMFSSSALPKAPPGLSNSIRALSSGPGQPLSFLL